MHTITVYSYLRFSTTIQAEGASLQRQTERTAEWLAAKNKLGKGHYALDTTLRLSDEGVSAYRGKNATTGALAAFLKEVAEERVAEGSYLVVESLDRLSREQVTAAMGLFLSIVGQGITIVTLADGQEYSHEILSANPYPLVMSLITMIRAHEESAMKGMRVAHAWQAKRDAALASGRALTRQCPAWLGVEGGRKDRTRTYFLIKERVEVVRWIFEQIAAGWGQGRIANELTRKAIAEEEAEKAAQAKQTKAEEHLPSSTPRTIITHPRVYRPWGGSKRSSTPRGMRWHDSYVLLISKNRAVLGELQLYKGDGKSRREAVGAPIPNYYPAIVERTKGTAIAGLRMAENAHAVVLSRSAALEADASRIKMLAEGKLDAPDARLRLREEIRRVVHRIDVSFSKRGGFYMIVNYSNGASRYIRPNRNGDGVKILDHRECGFTGTPEEWRQGGGRLFDWELDPEATPMSLEENAS